MRFGEENLEETKNNREKSVLYRTSQIAIVSFCVLIFLYLLNFILIWFDMDSDKTENLICLIVTTFFISFNIFGILSFFIFLYKKTILPFCKKLKKEFKTGLTRPTNIKYKSIKSKISTGNSVIDEQLSRLGDFDHFFTMKEIKYLPRVIEDDENILGLTSGFNDGNTWLIVVTDKKLVFLDCGFLWGIKKTELKLKHIKEISFKRGIIFGEINISTGFGGKRITNIDKKYVERICNIISELIEKNENKTMNVNILADSRKIEVEDNLSKIEKIFNLKEKGILTEEEFEKQKNKYL